MPKFGTVYAIPDTDQRASPASLSDIINRALANTKVGPGEVEDINTHPPGLPGGKYSMD